MAFERAAKRLCCLLVVVKHFEDTRIKKEEIEIMSDAINPSHYKHLPVEAIEIIEAAIAKAPSNEVAYLHGQVLKYLLRCWEKNGFVDLGKAKWYLDRLVNRDQLAEVAGAIPDLPINEPKPSKDQPPSGYRMLGDAKDEPRRMGDFYWSRGSRNWFMVLNYQVEHANSNNWAACRKIDQPNNNPTANPSGTEPPSGYRWLACGDKLVSGDLLAKRGSEIQPIPEIIIGDPVAVERLFVRRIEVQK